MGKKVFVHEARDIVREEDGTIRAVYMPCHREQGYTPSAGFGEPYWMLHIHSHPSRCPATTVGPFASPEEAAAWAANHVPVREDLR